VIQEMWGQYQETEADMQKFHLWEQLGWQGTRAIFDALKAVKYSHCKSIRLWKTSCEDEGVRALCEYLKIAPNVLLLELLDNQITKLGCEFISRIIRPEAKTNIMYLKLDHNSFGSEGIKMLATGLSQNKII
jgi:Ran GTPase-activating protein (RanGAP) involved in mRNA processing and transport